mgnify:CR=1 FL=1
MDMTLHEWIGAIALALSFGGSVVYILSILKGQSKPHLYTWLVWSILPTIAFFAQIHDNAGPGAWVTGMTALSCSVTTLLALRYGEKNITRGDRWALAASLIAIVPWLITDDPFWSVILVAIIDTVAFIPTFRKSWHKPYEENLSSYNLHSLKMTLSMFALTNVTVITILYPLSFVAVNIVFTVFCFGRRLALKHR